MLPRYCWRGRAEEPRRPPEEPRPAPEAPRRAPEELRRAKQVFRDYAPDLVQVLTDAGGGGGVLQLELAEVALAETMLAGAAVPPSREPPEAT